MGTRGLYGFRKNGKDKMTYNHWDSYPEALGKHILEFVKETSIEELNNIYDKIILVDERSVPAKKDIKNYLNIANLDIGDTDKSIDWYSLLHNAQGDLNWYKKNLTHMIDNQDFIKDSLFCEWAYIINLDTNKVEIWKGFRNTPNEQNRYGAEMQDGYYPCSLIKEYDIENIDVENIINELVQKEEEENEEDIPF